MSSTEHWYSRFSFFGRKEHDEPTRGAPRRPGNRDMTASFQSNEPMLRGMYHGNYPGLQFASPLCFTPVNLLVQFMGYPTPKAIDSADTVTQAALDYIMLTMADKVPRNHRGSFITGNSWRWPRFDSRTNSLVWEAIPDMTVQDILIDVMSENPFAILTDEMIKLSTGENQIINVQRKRRFEPDMVGVRWYGQKPANVKDYTARNVAGMLPINFPNEADEGDVRGWSVFARIIRDLKDYHDSDYRISETLTKFRPKQKQRVKNLADWLANNGLTTETLSDLDIANNDFVVNIGPDEETDFDFLPEGATAALEKALERKYWKVVEGSGIPELFWGPLATGNHASTDTQLQQAVDYAIAKRKEFDNPWKALLVGSLRVLSVARGETYKDFSLEWNRLEAVSPAMKSKIMLEFAQTLNAFITSASCTEKQAYELWKLNFPESQPGTFEEWQEGIKKMIVHKQALGESYFDGLDSLNASKEKKDKKPEDLEEGGEEAK